MKKSITTIIALIALVASGVFAQSIHYEAADSSPAIRIYNGGTETVTIAIYSGGAAATNSVTIGSTATAVDGSGDTDTVAELAAAIIACTNSAGSTVLTADTDCVAATTESTDGELLDGTYTAAAGAWLEIPWDTSDVKFYSVYIPDAQAGGIRVSNSKLKTAYGNPTGTGNVTLSVYKGGALVYQQLMPEVYAYSNNTATVALPVSIDIPVGSESVLVKAERATTATTGLLGIVLE